MPRGLKKRSKPRTLLDELIVSIENLDDYFNHPSEILYAGSLEAFQERRRWKETSRRRAALKSLETQKFIEIRRRGNRMYVQLTEKGCLHALRERIRSSHKSLPKGHWCYVSFDIPQHVQRFRSLLRDVLKDARFRMRHQSLWISDRDVGDDMARFVKALRAEDWIHVSVGKALTE
jgi:DNA-binding transcriptional regulator PaaX